MASKQHLFLIVVETGNARSKHQPDWEPCESLAVFLLCPHMAELVRELSGASFIKALIPFMKAPLLCPNHLWTPIPSVIITLGTQFQHMKLGGQVQSIALSLTKSLPHPHYPPPSTTHHSTFLIKTLYRYSFRNMFWVPLFARHCVRVGHNWAISLSLFTFMQWRRKWQPTPEFLPGESQGRGSLVGCCLWGRTESDMTEAT